MGQIALNGFLVDTANFNFSDVCKFIFLQFHFLFFLLLPLLISQQSSYFLVEVRVNTLGLIENFVFLFRFLLGNSRK